MEGPGTLGAVSHDVDLFARDLPVAQNMLILRGTLLETGRITLCPTCNSINHLLYNKQMIRD